MATLIAQPCLGSAAAVTQGVLVQAQPSFVRAFCGFVASVCLMTALMLMAAA
jgi:hypothetical protein